MKFATKENAKFAAIIERADIEQDVRFFETIEAAQEFVSEYNIQAVARSCYNTTGCADAWSISVREYELDADGYDAYAEDAIYMAWATCNADGMEYEVEA